MTHTGSDELHGLVDKVFADKVGHDRVLAAEHTDLLRDLWATLADLGLPGIGIAEEAGGSGGALADVVTLLRASGRFAVPLPLLEHHLAAWVVTVSGGHLDGPGPWSIAPGTAGDTLTCDGERVWGTLGDVAWGRAVDRVVALVGDRAHAEPVEAQVGDPTHAEPVEAQTGPRQARATADMRARGMRVVVLDPAEATIETGRDLAGQPRDVLTFDGAPARVLTAAVTDDQLRQRGAVLRAAQMSGAMGAVYETTNAYVYQREQFGRPVGTFQAVRSHLVQLAQMAVMTTLSVDRAAAALESGTQASFAACAAKLLADQNAALSVRSGHQAHGAIGMTRDYVLQDFTRRLNAWRGDWGTERALAERIGTAVLGAGRVATVATDAGSVTV